ncbi:MAG TPA: class I SAM-dependent methyltransferase [Gammaproteobacteria bacterium]
MTTNNKTRDPQIAHAPHAPLTDYYADESGRKVYVQEVFDHTAPHYDRIERLLAFGTGPWYRHHALLRAGLKPGMRVIDVGTGTGLVAREAAAIVGDPELVKGVDPSTGMMAQTTVPVGVELFQGRAEQLPFPDASFDFLSMGYALRHISDLSVAFTEFRRVLKPGGKLCLMEITLPESRLGRLLLKGYMRGVVPLLSRAVGADRETAQLWRYYWDTIEACVPPGSVVATLNAAGFDDARRYSQMRKVTIFTEFQATRNSA